MYEFTIQNLRDAIAFCDFIIADPIYKDYKVQYEQMRLQFIKQQMLNMDNLVSSTPK
jgi:hypothetical protein